VAAGFLVFYGVIARQPITISGNAPIPSEVLTITACQIGSSYNAL